jgi:hypothetical protein
MTPKNLHATALSLLSGALLACAPVVASDHREHPRKPVMSPSPSVEVSPTARATATVPPTGSHDPSRWHPPGFGHEHGDPPPDWLVQADADPTFHTYFGTWLDYQGPFSTSTAENAAKHAGMKGYRLTYHPDPALGFSGTDGSDLDGYVTLHTFSNPMDRGAQFHSARVAIWDGAGLTLRQGWVNYGDPATARVPARCSEDRSAVGGPDCPALNAAQRPVVLFVDQATWDGVYRAPSRHEQWYGFGIGFAWGVGFNTTTIRTPGELVTDTDPAHWHLTGQDGTLRSLDLNACNPGSSGCSLPATVKGQAFLTDPKGNFMRFGDPRCEADVPCLIQYISPTYKGIRGRRLDIDHPNPPGGVVLPN